MRSRFIRIVAAGALATAFTGALAPSNAMPLPVTTAERIAGAAPTDPVRWYYGYGWHRRHYGGALAAGLVAGGILGLAATAAAAPYYGYAYGYPAYYGYGYPAYYGYPGYYRPYAYYPRYYYGYRRAYWRPSYWGYRRAYWRPYGWRYRRVYWR